ncbi:DUF2500 family protein [Paenibacillus sp. 1011MAR3C5]|uniref:DUF2500 domain-containing protein n=1 Tax=Paenibacillus sp. 1011MAR3C5 TaxID=1675787 RepID=UPI000E6C14F1|nr:DUF2500 domain-containing protein [Paenibacillus sp. 1011MAR3C5]RJE87576.1 DUF2500 family protein [Paenibacillus sp. 1011MAR3C5]
MYDFGPGSSFPGGGGGFDFMFTVVPIIIIIGFIFMFGLIVYSIIIHFRNARAPQESAYARIIAKRMDVQSHSNHNHNHHHNHHHHHHQENHIGHTSSSSHTYYYITLEFDNGSRKEFLDVKGLYGLVVEGDAGYAATKGDWIVAFERSAG